MRRAAERLWDAFVALGTLAACLGLVLLVIVGLLLPLALVAALLTMLLVPLIGWSWGVFVVLMFAEGAALFFLSEEDD